MASVSAILLTSVVSGGTFVDVAAWGAKKSFGRCEITLSRLKDGGRLRLNS